MYVSSGELPVQIIFLFCPQDYFHIQRFARRTHGTQHTVVLTAKICYSNVISTESWITREKDRCSLEDSVLQASLCSLPHVRGHTVTLPRAVKMWQHTCAVCVHGSSLETHTQGFLSEVGTFRLVHVNIPDSGKESRNSS